MQEQRYPLEPLPTQIKPTPLPPGYVPLSKVVALDSQGRVMFYVDDAWKAAVPAEDHMVLDDAGQLDYFLMSPRNSGPHVKYRMRFSHIMAWFYYAYTLNDAKRRQLKMGARFMYELDPSTGQMTAMRFDNEVPDRPQLKGPNPVWRIPVPLLPLLDAVEKAPNGQVIHLFRPGIPHHIFDEFPAIPREGKQVRVPRAMSRSQLMYLIPRLPEACQQTGAVLDVLYVRDFMMHVHNARCMT
jgi:hypothetical protein